jgi:tetratricopeptide (TPR) repeat protein
MVKAFESTDGDLAEKLFAALKAGDDAGGDSRGKQSASMLVVGKGRGRNINNDRLIYINVDDSPAPIPELRRLLDINQGWLYQQWMGQLRSAGKTKEARDAAAKYAKYMPSANAQLNLGVMDYELGDKPAALADFRKAFELDPNIRKQFEQGQPSGGRGGQRLKTILEDKAFLEQLLK